MDDSIEARIEALERAVTDGDHDLSGLAAEGEATDRLETLEATVSDLEDRVGELEAGTQALRGYVGNLRSVNRDVEQRADAALAKAESLESRLSADSPRNASGPDEPTRPSGTDAAAEPVGESRASATESRTSPTESRASQTESRTLSTEASPERATGNRDDGHDGMPRADDEPILRLHTEPDTGGANGETPPAGQSQTPSEPTGRGSGQSRGEPAPPDRCSSCGRPHPEATDEGGHTASEPRHRGADSGRQGGNRHRQSQATDASADEGPLDSLVGSNGHDETEAAGTIERIRRML